MQQRSPAKDRLPTLEEIVARNARSRAVQSDEAKKQNPPAVQESTAPALFAGLY